MTHRPTLYIGIGGTGCKTLALIKRNFIDEFGEGKIPEHIRFFGIDTDICMEREVWDDIHLISPQHVKADEYLSYNIKNKTGRCDWYIDNHQPIPEMKCGAGANRSYARLIMEMDSSVIMHKIRTIISELMDAAHCVLDSIDIDVRLVMSLAGGTGSGIFIPLAVLLSQYKAVNLYGYAVMHGIFRKTDLGGLVYKRAFIHTYSSILELDYLQHASVDNQIKMSIAGNECILKAPLFKGFYMIEHLNDAGKIIQNCQDMFKVLALSMFSSSFNTGKVTDPDFQNGLYDIKNKKGWLGSVGACEITYKGDKIAELYSHKVAQTVVSEMLKDSGYSQYSEVRKFLISNQLSDSNELISNLASRIGPGPKKRLALSSGKYNSCMKELDEYLSIQPGDLSPIHQTLTYNLHYSIRELGNNTHRLLKFLDTLCTHLQTLNQDLTNEILGIKTSLMSLQKSFDESLNTLRNPSFIRSLLEAILPATTFEIEEQAYEIAKIKHEIVLREEAIEIVEALKTKAGEYIEKAKRYQDLLKDVNIYLLDKMEHLEKDLPSTPNPFILDTTTQYWNEQIRDIVPDTSDISINPFSDYLESEFKQDEMIDHILSYTSLLQTTCNYEQMSLGEAISSMSENQYKAIIRFIRTSAIRMLMLNGHGYMIGDKSAIESMTRNVVVSIYGQKPSKMEDDMKEVWKLWDNCQTNIVWNRTTAEHFRQRGIISLQEGGIIPYCIEAFYPEMVKKEYLDVMESGKYNPHTDAIILERMKLSGHSLKPEQVVITPESHQATVNIAQQVKKTIKAEKKKHVTKVFIAGSKELKAERALIREELSKVENTYDINIRSVTFEDFKTSLKGQQGGRQTDYNKFIRDEADIVIFIFDSKAGSITEEEFDIAYDALAESGRPDIFVYGHNMSETDCTLQKIKEKVFSYGKEYYVEYEDLKNLRYLVFKDMMTYFIR
jgi:hypothetical protein